MEKKARARSETVSLPKTVLFSAERFFAASKLYTTVFRAPINNRNIYVGLMVLNRIKYVIQTFRATLKVHRKMVKISLNLRVACTWNPLKTASIASLLGANVFNAMPFSTRPIADDNTCQSVFYLCMYLDQIKFKFNSVRAYLFFDSHG